MRAVAAVAGLAAAALVLLSSSIPAQALGFEAWLVYDGFDPDGNETVVWKDLSQAIKVNSSGVGVISNWSWTCSETQCTDGGFRVDDLDVTLDPDPVITFGSSVLDVGAPSTFTFVFMQGILATQAPGSATSSLQGGTTNGGGGPGVVTVTPASPPAGISQDGPDQGSLPDEIMVYSLSTNGGATWQNVGLDLGPAFSSNPLLVSDNYGSFGDGPAAGPAGSGFYDAMRVDVNLSLSGGSDVFVFSGNATIIPEPTTASLMALGLVGLAWTGRRRRL